VKVLDGTRIDSYYIEYEFEAKGAGLVFKKLALQKGRSFLMLSLSW
jgi:hypothetical protein